MKIQFLINDTEVNCVELEGITTYKDIQHTIEVIVNDLHIEKNIPKTAINVIFKQEDSTKS